MLASDFDFDLPPDQIAQHPLADRGQSRLLILPAEGPARDARFAELPAQLAPGDLLVLNDTRVLRARLFAAKSGSGGRVELLIERIGSDPHDALAMLRASKPPRPGSRLELTSTAAQVTGREGEFWRLRFDHPVAEVLRQEGRLPLPPYIRHAPDDDDGRRYQTVFAREDGSVAAPTAGLHFDDGMLQRLTGRGLRLAWLTLHVGAGTFTPVRVDDLAQHRMHAERYALPAATSEAIGAARHRGARIVAVGTTVLRTLESIAAEHDGEVPPQSGETRLFVTPGFRFRVVDRLLTNFHLPRSTLLMLACAFGGTARVLQAYDHAVAGGYRFFSYGDAMLIDRALHPADEHGCR